MACVIYLKLVKIMIILKNGTNLTNWEDVKNKKDVRYVSEDLSDFTDKSHMVIKSAKIASDPEIMLVGNDGYIHSENIFYL